MDALGKLVDRAYEELGPGATDEDVALRVLDYLKKLSDPVKAEAADQVAEVVKRTERNCTRPPSRGDGSGGGSRDSR